MSEVLVLDSEVSAFVASDNQIAVSRALGSLVWVSRVRASDTHKTKSRALDYLV